MLKICENDACTILSTSHTHTTRLSMDLVFTKCESFTQISLQMLKYTRVHKRAHKTRIRTHEISRGVMSDDLPSIARTVVSLLSVPASPCGFVCVGVA